MKKIISCIYLLVLIIISTKVSAQIDTTNWQDTVCINQDITISTLNNSASSYYWGTCSAWLLNKPKGSTLTSGLPLNSPSPISLNKDANNYFLFTINTAGSNDLIRYDFGTSLQNTPNAINLSNFGSILPANARSLYINNFNGNWYGFVVAGTVNVKFLRLDFGSSLANLPVATDFGNLAGLLINPQDMHVFFETGNYYGYTFNKTNGDLLRLDFGSSISNLPTITTISNPDPGNINSPTGFYVLQSGINYHMFVISNGNNSIERLDFGTSLLNVPVATSLGSFAAAFSSPRDISIIMEDKKYVGLVTNELGNYLSKLTFGTSITNIPTVSNLGNIASFNGSRNITTLYREYDNIYGFITNVAGNSISTVQFDSNTNATMLKSNVQNPPVYQYTQPGTYNVYLQTITNGVIQEDQHQIYVHAKPKADFHQDTLICQGDTIFMVANAGGLKSVIWDPIYNLIPRNDTTSVFVYPEEDYRYHVRMSYLDGCIVDTSVLVKVSKIKADAGADFVMADGAVAKLGGPKMSLGYQFTYAWSPDIDLDDSTLAYPTTNLSDTLLFYYLKVTNLDGCVSRDTVLVKSFCGDINAPNAFNPTSSVPDNRYFGIANYQLNKLDYFRVFNRYGQMVFETTNPAMKWDGNFKGLPQPNDTYIWVGSGVCNNGRKVKKNGNVLLIR